jgi:hypothetical protein
MDRLLPWLLYEILEHFLPPKLLITTSEQAIVLHSSSMTASVAVNRAYAAAYNDQVPQDRITDHDYIGLHNLPQCAPSDLKTAIGDSSLTCIPPVLPHLASFFSSALQFGR